MSNSTVSVLIGSALVCAIPGLLGAQGAPSAATDPPATYQVTGVISDAAREPVPDVEVMVVDPIGGESLGFLRSTSAAGHPNVNANAAAPGSRNSISNWRGAIGFG